VPPSAPALRLVDLSSAAHWGYGGSRQIGFICTSSSENCCVPPAAQLRHGIYSAWNWFTSSAGSFSFRLATRRGVAANYPLAA
jgi:hypothetical protein